jgi:thioredoxin
MEINSVELQEKINSGNKIILKLGAPWCGPCRIMDPIFEKVASENTSDVEMYTMNVDLNREISAVLGIKSIPTVKIFNAGQVVETKVGMLSEGQINGLVTELLNG